MKGVVFTEFLEMVEAKFGAEVSDKIIDGAQLPNDGAYTSVGTYDYTELVRLVTQLSNISNTEMSLLIKVFGKYLFGRFVTGFPIFFENVDNTFTFLEGVHGYIHEEVRKLYSDAELPTFNFEFLSETTVNMHYRSKRPFADLADGLIAGCVEHFGEDIVVEREDVEGNEGYEANFRLTTRVPTRV